MSKTTLPHTTSKPAKSKQPSPAAASAPAAPLTQGEINDIVWSACDSFRGKIGANLYKNYILVMLFIKYISDIRKHALARYHEQYKGNKNRIERRMEREQFIIPDGHTFDDLFNKRMVDNLGDEINKTIAAIERANPRKLENVLGITNFNSDTIGEVATRNSVLRHLLEDFNHPRLVLHPDNVSEDVLGESYMYLVEQFGNEVGKTGEFFTPQTIRRLVAQLVAPKAGNTIYDPTCGSASLLIDTAREIDGKNFALYGQESNSETVAMAKMNICLHGLESEIERGDVLNAPKHLEGSKIKQFDIVVANPPYSLDKWGESRAAKDIYNRFWRGIPPKSKGDWAFISHMLESAKPQAGRIVVVVPHGVLFRGASEGKIREQVIKDNQLDAVIGLPANLFSSVGIPVALLVLDKRRERGGALQKRKEVLFIDASQHYKADSKRNELREQDIERILSAFKNRKPVDKFANTATIAQIAENGYNLNIPRYVDTFEEEAPIDIVAVQKDIKKLEADLVRVRGEMNQLLKGITR